MRDFAAPPGLGVVIVVCILKQLEDKAGIAGVKVTCQPKKVKQSAQFRNDRSLDPTYVTTDEAMSWSLLSIAFSTRLRTSFVICPRTSSPR